LTKIWNQRKGKPMRSVFTKKFESQLQDMQCSIWSDESELLINGCPSIRIGSGMLSTLMIRSNRIGNSRLFAMLPRNLSIAVDGPVIWMRLFNRESDAPNRSTLGSGTSCIAPL
jgi:hypothetical protein